MERYSSLHNAVALRNYERVVRERDGLLQWQLFSRHEEWNRPEDKSVVKLSRPNGPSGLRPIDGSAAARVDREVQARRTGAAECVRAAAASDGPPPDSHYTISGLMQWSARLACVVQDTALLVSRERESGSSGDDEPRHSPLRSRPSPYCGSVPRGPRSRAPKGQRCREALPRARSQRHAAAIKREG